MRNPNRSSNQVWIESVPRMLAKESRIRGKQAGVQDFQYAGKIDLSIFRIRMIAMNA